MMRRRSATRKVALIIGSALCLLLLLSTPTVFAQSGGGGEKNLRLVSLWSELEYEFPSQSEHQNALIQGKYISGAGIPIDMDVDYRARGQTKVFVTVPRFQTGVPITLGTLNGQRRNGGPVLSAYPDYSWHSSHGKNCDGLTSVFRVAIDECRRLWVLDTGRIGAVQLCRPQLLVFDLRTDRLIHRYKFPEAQVHVGMSLFVTPIVDVRDPGPVGRCENTKVYIADVTGFGILVYDLRLNRSWRTTNKLVYPHPYYGTFTVAGETFDLMDGIIGMTLSPRDTTINQRSYGLFGSIFGNQNAIAAQSPAATESNRILYFHAMASVTENAVPLRILDNSTMWEENPEATPRSFVEIGNRGTQSVAQAMDKFGNMFFGMLNPLALACWDSRTDYNQQNIKIVAQSDEILQFVTGLKIITNGNGEEELWLLTNRFQKVMTGTMSTAEPNFRIFAVRIRDLIGGTQCSGRNTNNFQFPRY